MCYVSAMQNLADNEENWLTLDNLKEYLDIVA